MELPHQRERLSHLRGLVDALGAAASLRRGGDASLAGPAGLGRRGLSAVRGDEAQAGGLAQQQLPPQTRRARLRLRRLRRRKGPRVASFSRADLPPPAIAGRQIHPSSHGNALDRRGAGFVLDGQSDHHQEDATVLGGARGTGATDAARDGEGVRYCV